MKKFLFKTTLLTVSVLFSVIFIFCSMSFAAPVSGEVFEFKQPDGSNVRVRLWGDEFYMRAESLDGYALVQDQETGWICYAELKSDESDFVSTGIAYKDSNEDSISVQSTPNPKGKKLTKGLKLKKNHIDEKVKKSKERLFQGDTEAIEQLSSVGEVRAYAEPVMTSVKGITLLIDFPDTKSSISKTEIDNMINMRGYTGYKNNGSVRDYFYDVSGGALDYTNYVTEFYTAKNPKSYYDNINGGRAPVLIKEALDALRAKGFDFSTLTRDSSGYVMGLNALYAGSPSYGWSKGLWPHMGSFYTIDYNGIKFRRYQISNIGNSLSIGTFVHENGHLICKWPDLYDYDGDSKGAGRFCVMASSGGTNPVPPNPYLRSLMGWGSITELNTYPNNSTVSLNANSISAYRYRGPYSNEFFMVENISRKGRWTNMPGDGLLIWHVDKNGNNNYQDMTSTRHYVVSVEQADGQFQIEKNASSGDKYDYFYQGHKTEFNRSTVPNSNWWNGSASGFSLSNLSSIGSVMTFTIQTGVTNSTFTPNPTATPTLQQTPTQRITPTPTQRITPMPTPTQRITPTPTPTQRITPTPTQTQRITPTPTPKPTLQPTIQPTVTPTPASSSGNLVKNPGFEYGTYGWGTGWGGFKIVNENPKSGLNSIKIGTINGGVYQFINGIKEGKTYKFSGWGMVTATGDTARLYVYFNNSSGSALVTKVLDFGGYTSYTYKEIVLEAPVGATNVRIDVWKVSGSQYFFADDITFEEYGTSITPTPIITATPIPSATPAVSTENYALKKYITASSYNIDRLPSYAVDGNPSTYWVASSSTSQWMWVDLGTSRKIGSMKIKWSQSNYAKTYDIESWNGSSWVVKKAIIGGPDWNTITFDSPFLSRYVRIKCTSNNDSYYAIYELQVYGAN